MDSIKNTTETQKIPVPIKTELQDILIIGTASIVPIMNDALFNKHRMTRIEEIYGKSPFTVRDLSNPANDTKTTEKISRALGRSITHQVEQLQAMLSEKEIDANSVFVYAIQDSTSAELVLFENDTSITGNAFDDPVKGRDEAVSCIRLVARRSGDEANGFSIAITVDNVTGKSKMFTLQYSAITSSTIVPIDNENIKRPYSIDLEGLSTHQLIAEINKPNNPFAQYIKAIAMNPRFIKNIETFDKNARITLQSTEDGKYVGGAYRLQDIENISVSNNIAITATPGDITITTNSDIVQTEMGSITDPKIQYSINTNLELKNGLADINNIAIVTDPILVDHVTKVYSSVFFDTTKKAGFSGNFDDVAIVEMLGDGVPLAKNEHYAYNKLTGKVEFAAYIIDGLMDTDINLFRLEDKAKEGNFLASSDYIIAITFFDKYGRESQASVYKLITTDGGDSTAISLFFNKALDKAVSEVGIYVSQTINGVETEPRFTQTFRLDNGGGAIVDHEIELDIVPELNAKKVPTIDTTIYANETITTVYKITPRFREAQNLDKMPKNLWNNYFISKNTIQFGMAIPIIGDGNTVFTATVKVLYDLRDSEINIISRGDSGRAEDTITLDFTPSDTLASMDGGELSIIYRVYPQLPAHTKGVSKRMIGGSENSNMSDEAYVDRCFAALAYSGQIFKPSNVYICGIYQKMTKEVRNTTTRQLDLLPIYTVAKLSAIVNALNSTANACILHLGTEQPTFKDLTDFEVDLYTKQIVEDHTKLGYGTTLGYTLADAKQNISNMQIFFSSGDMNKLYNIPGYGIFWLPISPALVNLRDVITQDFEFDITALKFNRLSKSTYKSYAKPMVPADLEKINNRGYCYYGTFRDTSLNQTVAGCCGIARTGYIVPIGSSSLAMFTNYVSAQTLVIKLTREYLDLDVRGNSTLDEKQLKSVSGKLIEFVLSKFPSEMLANYVIDVSWGSRAEKTLGRMKVKGTSTFMATGREFDMEFGFELVKN